MGLVRIQMSSKYKIYTRFLRLSTKKAHQNFYIDCMMKWQYWKDTGLHKNIKINFPCFFLVCYVATGKCATYTCASHSIPAGQYWSTPISGKCWLRPCRCLKHLGWTPNSSIPSLSSPASCLSIPRFSVFASCQLYRLCFLSLVKCYVQMETLWNVWPWP